MAGLKSRLGTGSERSGLLGPVDEAQVASDGKQDTVHEDALEESEEAHEIPHKMLTRVKQPTGHEIVWSTLGRTCLLAFGARFVMAQNSSQKAIKREVAADCCFFRDVIEGSDQPVFAGRDRRRGDRGSRDRREVPRPTPPSVGSGREGWQKPV